MNTSLAELSGVLEDDFEAFSSDQLIPFFPEPYSTSFQIRNDREVDWLFSIIAPDPFTVQGASMDFPKKSRTRSFTDVTTIVAVSEDMDMDFTPEHITLQFSNRPAALEL